MQTAYYLWIGVAVIASALFAWYSYFFKEKRLSNSLYYLAVLRFISVLSAAFLLINPKFVTKSFQDEKPVLSILLDQSKSIDYLNASEQLNSDYQSLIQNEDLVEKFEIRTFALDDNFEPFDSLNFKGDATNISNGLSKNQELFKSRNNVTLLLTDGNQSRGRDLAFTKLNNPESLFPIIYGDTTVYDDFRIGQVNVNKYSYLKNEFPVEIFVQYSGDVSRESRLTIKNGNQIVYRENLTFSKNNSSTVISALLESTSIGTQRYQIAIEPFTEEKNTSNNYRNFAVEVIDQQTKVAIITASMHPDVGALRKAIESNQQRTVEIVNPDKVSNLNEYNLIIFYGVNQDLKPIIKQVKLLGKNTWWLLGESPDIQMINSLQNAFSIENSKDVDEVQPILNENFTAYNVDSFSFNDYPPVRAPFGMVSFNTPIDILFYKQIGSVETADPLWFNYEENTNRHSVTMGAGLWRWRSQSFIESTSFTNFDDLVSSQVQLLASNKKRKRLDVDYNSFYYQNNEIVINAIFLNKNYEFEDSGILNLYLTNLETSEKIIRPFVLSNNTYKVNLSDIEPADYNFTVKVENDVLTQSGKISILEFDIEKQFTSASSSSFNSLIDSSNIFYAGETNKVLDELLDESKYKTIEKATLKYSSLIDWHYLLGVLLLSLGLEWFIRKYNGLI
ncbi:hypothetical protein [Nonlabens sp. SY33080]|uniref:hypothetical protein n=1 Tax=Nonlabens sp. SY33080 TaxID=2719911 RepID=UPI0014289FE5|nr:hypothetical protein [Nonlabens sp. SY33080]